jgi:hypothetical protein
MRLAASFAILISSLSWAQSSGTKFNYETRAKPLALVLADISSLVGKTLKSDPEIESEPIIVHVDGVTTDQLEARIAEVFKATWVKDGDALELKRTVQSLGELKAAISSTRRGILTEALGQLAREASKLPRFDAHEADLLVADCVRPPSGKVNSLEWNSGLSVALRMPINRLALNILQATDATQLVSLGPNGRAVFSNLPTGEQQALPKLEPSLLGAYFRERAILKQAIDREGFVPNDNEADRELLQVAKDFGAHSPRLLLVSSADVFGRLSHVELLVFNANGELRDSASLDLPTTRDSYAQLVHQISEARSKLESDGFRLGKVAGELAPRMGFHQDDMRVTSDEAITAITSPASVDPLAFAASDILLDYASKAKTNVVALLPDAAEMTALRSASSGKTSFRLLVPLLSRDADVSCTESMTWTLLSPVDPIAVEHSRIPRIALDQFMKAAYRERFLSWPASLRFYSSIPWSADLWLPTREITWIVTSDAARLIAVDPRILQLYSGLSGIVEEPRVGSVSLTYGEMTPEQQQEVHGLLFCANPPFGIQSAGSLPQQDVTDMLPEGIPADATLTFNVESLRVPIVWVTDIAGNDFKSATDLDSLAQLLVKSEKKIPLTGNNLPLVVKGIGFTEQKTVRFHLDLTSGLAVDESYALSPNPNVIFHDRDAFLALLSAEERARLDNLISTLREGGSSE